MEKKKIDLDAPLLSIRRFSVEPPTSSSPNSNYTSTTNQAHRRSSLPFYKPDIKSGPVRNPGVIPFVWEQRPGQPKPGTAPSRPPVAAPRPPPVKLGSSVRTRKPVNNWSNSVKEIKDPYFEDFSYSINERLEEKQEQIKEEEEFDERPQVVVESVQANAWSTTRNENQQTREKENLEKEKQKKEEENKTIDKEEQKVKEKENEQTEAEEEEEDEGEDNFSDALDTLSRTESYFMNCSVSGLSELPAGLTKKPSLPGGTDADAREFMIGRFLPAAQAVATGSPQYTFRKAPVPGRESTKPPQSIVGMGINAGLRRVPVPLPYQHQPKYDNNFDEEVEDVDEEDDDEEELEESRKFYAKGCGFLPNFCMKGSFLMMNPVPGMKGRVKEVPSYGSARRRTGNPIIRSSYNGSISKHSDEGFENYMVCYLNLYLLQQS